MKYQSYSKVYEVDVWALKVFLLKIASNYQMAGLEKVILLSKDLEEIQYWVKKSAVYQKKLFISLKKQMDNETAPAKMETLLIYMRLLLKWDNPLYIAYRQKLMHSLEAMCNPYFTADIYCLMRHLVKPGPLYRNRLIKNMTLADDETQQYFLCEIYLIEENYQMAYTCLKTCRYEGVLREYDFELKAYHSLKYRRYALKQPLFKNLNRGELLWMKEQLKY